MDSLRCPITHELFQDPVMGQDGHTYERKAITDWLQKNETSPITREQMDVSTLRTNHIVKKMIDELAIVTQSQQTQYRFKLNVDIRKTKPRPLFQTFGKVIYEVEWISRDGPPIILLKIDGAKASREASFYVHLSCHPHIVRTFGLVESSPGSVMLLQECAPMGDLSELLREDGFRPNERVVCEIFIQISDAMICLADNGIVHGDLACRNVLVFKSNATEPKDNLVKLTDFGLTRTSTLYSMVDSVVSSTITNVPVRYAAPEILQEMNGSNYSEKSDVYSMGVLMWEACSQGVLPYLSLNSDADVRRQKLNDKRLPQPSLCSHQLWTIMNQCWHQQPDDRPDFRLLKQSLSDFQHQYTTDAQQRAPSLTTPNPARSPTNDRASDNGKVQIPCEICSESIDYSDWTAHTEMCAKRDRRRIATRVRQEHFIEQVPCEYCEQLFPARDLNIHQMDCTRNPENVSRARQFIRRYPPARPLLTVPSERSLQHATSSPSLSRAPHSKVPPTLSRASRDMVDRITEDQNHRTTLKSGRFAHYSSIDLDRTREANGLLENGAAGIIGNDHQRPLPRSISNIAHDRVRNEDKEPERFQNQRPRSSSTKSKKPKGWFYNFFAGKKGGEID